MTSSTQGMTPMRKRVVDDVRMASSHPRHRPAISAPCGSLLDILGRSLDTATVEDRRYQLHVVDHGISRIMLTSE